MTKRIEHITQPKFSINDCDKFHRRFPVIKNDEMGHASTKKQRKQSAKVANFIFDTTIFQTYLVTNILKLNISSITSRILLHALICSVIIFSRTICSSAIVRY